jgi:hypothetical protein
MRGASCRPDRGEKEDLADIKQKSRFANGHVRLGSGSTWTEDAKSDAMSSTWRYRRSCGDMKTDVFQGLGEVGDDVDTPVDYLGTQLGRTSPGWFDPFYALSSNFTAMTANRDEINRTEWANPRNWRGKFLGAYRGGRDSRAIVPKQNPRMGWTLNFANPIGKLLGYTILVLTILGVLGDMSGWW